MSKHIDYGSALDAPHYQPSEAVPEMDPAYPMQIEVTLDQLVPYANNPRTEPNPDYEDHKKSIAARGLENPFRVTREQPGQPYMIRDGGNTRLAILRELWEETKDPKFYRLTVTFHPWVSELDVFIGHILENEQRTDFLYIDRARAAARLRDEFQRSAETPLSIRELANRIREVGWTRGITSSTLGLMLFSHDVLLPELPESFADGLGRDSAQKIKQILGWAEVYWNTIKREDEPQFDEVWRGAWRSLDGPEFNLEDARADLCAHIAERLDTFDQHVDLGLQAVEYKTVDHLYRPPTKAETIAADEAHLDKVQPYRQQRQPLDARADAEPPRPPQADRPSSPPPAAHAGREASIRPAVGRQPSEHAMADSYSVEAGSVGQAEFELPDYEEDVRENEFIPDRTSSAENSNTLETNGLTLHPDEAPGAAWRQGHVPRHWRETPDPDVGLYAELSHYLHASPTDVMRRIQEECRWLAEYTGAAQWLQFPDVTDPRSAPIPLMLAEPILAGQAEPLIIWDEREGEESFGIRALAWLLLYSLPVALENVPFMEAYGGYHIINRAYFGMDEDVMFAAFIDFAQQFESQSLLPALASAPEAYETFGEVGRVVRRLRVLREIYNQADGQEA